jgi:hypothetical protein
MISHLEGYRDDKGRLEVAVKLEWGARRVFVVREDDIYDGQLNFTALAADQEPSWH